MTAGVVTSRVRAGLSTLELPHFCVLILLHTDNVAGSQHVMSLLNAVVAPLNMSHHQNHSDLGNGDMLM
jgi:hypothetical protein